MSNLQKRPSAGDDARDLIASLTALLHEGDIRSLALSALEVRGETPAGQILVVHLRGGLNRTPWQVKAVEQWPDV